MSAAHPAHSWWARVAAVPAAPAAALLAGLVFLFQSAQAYHANSPYFTFGVLHAFALLLPGFVLAFAVLCWIGSLGGARARHATATVMAALAIGAWGGATFLTVPKGVIDGRFFVRLPLGQEVALDAAWIAFAAAGAIAAWLRPTAVRRFFVALFALLAAQAAWIAATDVKPWPSAGAASRLATLSAERNVIVVVLDTFQSDLFADALAQDPSLRGALQGFTWFPHAVAHSPTTYLAIPTIHSGRALDGAAAMRDIYARDVVEGSFVASLSRAGYDAMLVNPVLGMCPAGATCEYQEAITLGRWAALVASSRFLVELALYRVAPETLKGPILRKDSTGQRHVVGSDRLITDLASGLQAGGTRPTMRFLHLFDTHPPIAFDAGCARIQGVAWARASALAQARCALSRVSSLLEALRQRGIYDKTAIVIVADHGAGFARGSGSGPGLQWGAHASPLFLAKPFGSRGDLVVSPRVVGLLDVAATVCTWTRDCAAPDGGNVLGPAPGGSPSYPFNAYVWNHKYWLEERVPISARYRISGPPLEPQSWRLVASAALARVNVLQFSAADPQEAFGSGWSHIEQEVRWAVGDSSELYIDLDPSRDARLDMSVLTHPANAGQSMVVEVNGTALGEVQVPVGNPTTVRIDVPRRVIGPEADRITFRYRKSNTPAGGQDPRRLAVLFLQLEVAAAP